MVKHLNKYLSLALALVLCLSLAACGESNEDYGDDGSDYNLYGVPDSFEGLVKDSEQMANLYLYGGAWTGEDGGTLIVATNDAGDEVRFALYDAGEEVTASGFIQFVPEYDYDYFYNEHDGVAYRSWFDEIGALYVAELGAFTQVTGDAPGENIGDTGFETMAGTWYLDAEADARSILVIDENGGWELLERPGGDGDPATVDCGAIEMAPDDDEELYLAVSNLFDETAYEFFLIDHDTMCWGSEFEYYQKMDQDKEVYEAANDDWEDVISQNGIPVLMGGALPFTNMQSLRAENYDDGAYRYEDITEDGQLLVVNAAEQSCFVSDVQELDDYLTACALFLSDADTYELLSVEENAEYSKNLSYPVYIVTYTAGENEDAREWTVFAMDTDMYTYLYGFCAAPDAAADMGEIYQTVFSQLYLSDEE